MLPSQPENPREQAKAVTLRSGTQLPEVEVRTEKEEAEERAAEKGKNSRMAEQK